MTTEFTLTGAPAASSAPAATLCRLTGYAIRQNGQPHRGVRLRVSSLDNPIVTSDGAVVGEQLEVVADGNGRLVVDLLQGASVQVNLSNMGMGAVDIVVPSASSADLWDVVFPYLVSVSLALDETALGVGDSAVGTVTGTLSDGRTVDVTNYATLVSSATAVAAVSSTSVVGVAAGSAAISVSAVDVAALYAQPPAELGAVFRDMFETAFKRLDAPAVTTGAAVTVTVS